MWPIVTWRARGKECSWEVGSGHVCRSGCSCNWRCLNLSKTLLKGHINVDWAVVNNNRAYHSYAGNNALRSYSQLNSAVTLQLTAARRMLRSTEKHTKEHALESSTRHWFCQQVGQISLEWSICCYSSYTFSGFSGLSKVFSPFPVKSLDPLLVCLSSVRWITCSYAYRRYSFL